MAGDREELESLRRLAELEARAGMSRPAKTTQDLYQSAVKEGGWGSGIPKAAEQVGGFITDQLAATGHSPEVAAGGGYLGNVASQAVPALTSSYRYAGEQLAPYLAGPAKMLMQSAVKPSQADRASGAGARAVQTMLDEGINPTVGGMDKASKIAGQLDKEVKAGIEQSNASIGTGSLRNYLLDPYRAARNQVNPKGDMETVRKVWADFLQHPDINGMAQIPVQLAQRLKSGTYKALGSKSYGEMGSAETEAQKALARGLREETLAQVPQVKAPLKREADLMNVKDVALNRALAEGNKNPMGLASLRLDNPIASAGFMADRSALIKAMLARGMYQGSRPNVVTPLGMAGERAVPQE